ncbi:MAG: STAS domain-containing protein [Cyanobacteria bacterium P01_H01_bin.74]
MTTDTIINNRVLGEKTIVDIEALNIDFRNAEAIKSAVATLVSKGSKDIIMNLSKVSFMDSSGLSVILFCKRSCEEVNGTFGAFGLQTYVNNLVNLTNLNKTISIYQSEAEATQ